MAWTNAEFLPISYLFKTTGCTARLRVVTWRHVGRHVLREHMLGWHGRSHGDAHGHALGTHWTWWRRSKRGHHRMHERDGRHGCPWRHPTWEAHPPRQAGQSRMARVAVVERIRSHHVSAAGLRRRDVHYRRVRLDANRWDTAASCGLPTWGNIHFVPWNVAFSPQTPRYILSIYLLSKMTFPDKWKVWISELDNEMDARSNYK